MANLNDNDIIFLRSREFAPFANLIEQSYGFKIISIDIPPFVSFTSRKAVVHTDSGDYFLKEKPLYCSDEHSLLLAAEFQNFLSERLKTVPSILKTKDNSWYVKWRDRFFFLSESRPGRVFNGTESDISKILFALKDFQSAATDFKFPNAPKMKSCETLSLLSLLKESGSITTPRDKKALNYFETVAQKLKHNFDSIPETEYVMSHGDFALFNILFNGDEIASINDFDNVAYFPRVHDMAEFLVSACIIYYLGPISNLRHPVFLKPNMNVLAQITAFYSQNFSLSENSKRLLAIVADIVWLEILVLAVLKEDYTIADIVKAVKELDRGTLRTAIRDEFRRRKKILYIWDFHETLETGTLYILTEIANTLLKENGSDKQYNPNEFAKIPSFSWNSFFRNHFPDMSAKEIEMITENAYNEKRFSHLLEKHSKANHGAMNVLRSICEIGGVNIIVSHSRQDKLGHYIKHVGLMDYVEEYYGIDDGTVRSPQDVLKKKTAKIREVLDQYKAYESVAVGDTEKDFNAARGAGVSSFYWLLSPHRTTLDENLYNGALPNRLKFIHSLEDITKDL